MLTIYDHIGAGYTVTRRPDPRVEAQILDALGGARSMVNVGAGAGAYEPRDRPVIAVEPSATMIRQRKPGPALAVQAAAEALPLGDGSVDAALAVLTVHHWTDPDLGLAELRRVARRRVVILTWDQDVWESFWLIREYLPGVGRVDGRRAVPLARIISSLGGGQIMEVPIPHDCTDGFHGAFWRKPAAYLDARVRAGISTYALMPADELARGVDRLRADLESGAWEARHGDLLQREQLDLGYRLVSWVRG